MGQALRSTTNVRRPVDMFFLPSGADQESNAGNSEDVSRADEIQDSSRAGEVTSSTTADGSHQETVDNTPKDAGQANEQVKSGSVDVSRETSMKSSTTRNMARTPASADGAADAAGDDVPGASGPASQQEAMPTGHSDQQDLQSVPGATFAEISVTDIHPNRKQPRQVFDEDELAELAFSVKELGVLQPIVVRPSHEGGEQNYELVMGERRWRAVQEAGLASIPAIIRDTADDDLLRDALLENLHRAQLNPLEEAAAYQQLMEEFGATQEQLSERIGRSRPQISNTLRLLRLPALVQRRVAAGVLSSGHARALLALTDPAEMERVAQRIVAEGLSVRATEELVALSDGLKRHATTRKTQATRHDDRLGYIADAFSDKLDTSVKIQLGARKGKMTIEFASVEDLNRIIDVLDPKLDSN
ncbi:ParB/RepB/Spo0J family partition protein [Kocuria marina]|uniref:ParB/RepB/Spo0J family partition protein n=1 Tax=Kocuria marina TaxID=223184 RepID=UPI0022E3196F|nr:ParB/RepB/Spo0J family partition protein [Kocuria marina]